MRLSTRSSSAAPGAGVRSKAAEHPAQKLPSEALAVALGALIAIAAPFKGADEGAASLLFRALRGSEPPASVLVVAASPLDLRDGTCARALPSLLESGGARAALILPPAGVFCGERGPVPTAELPASALRLDGDGHVIGFNDPGPGHEALRSITGDLARAPWVIPASPASVPALALRDLDAGRVPPSVLRDRVVVIGTESPLDMAFDHNGAPIATRAAAALGGLFAGGARTEAPFGSGGLVALLLGGAIALARRRSGIAAALYALAGAALFTVVLSTLLAAFTPAGVLPMASLLAGLAVAFTGLVIPTAVASRRALTKTAALLGKTVAGRARGLAPASDKAFWDRLAAFAERAFPADRAIIAELSPESFCIEFKNDRDHAFIDPRRDVRAAPFITARGAVAPHLTRGLLRDKSTPSVLVPLLAFGEIQGYLILCGERAARAFTEHPERAERLSRELGRLIRHRRARLDIEAPTRLPGASFRAVDKLIEYAHTANDDLQTLSALVREAPNAVLYADAFGDVRLVGRAFAEGLAAAGVSLPLPAQGGASGALPPGSMSLVEMLAAAGAQDPLSIFSSLLEGSEGASIQIAGSARTLHLKPLRSQSDGIAYIAGFMASLPAEDQAPASVRPSALVLMPAWAGEPRISRSLPDITPIAVAARKSAPPSRLAPRNSAPISVRAEAHVEDRLSWH